MSSYYRQGPDWGFWGVCAAGVVIVAGIAAIAVAASDDDEQYVNCVDPATNQVVPCDVENGGYTGTYVYWVSDSHYKTGHVVPSKNRTYVSPSDPNARAKAGLPSSGKVGGSKFSSAGGGSGSSGGSGKGSAGS